MHRVELVLVVWWLLVEGVEVRGGMCARMGGATASAVGGALVG